jgi:hypothetical protein
MAELQDQIDKFLADYEAEVASLKSEMQAEIAELEAK